jgi:hypothetical protein
MTALARVSRATSTAPPTRASLVLCLARATTRGREVPVIATRLDDDLSIPRPRSRVSARVIGVTDVAAIIDIITDVTIARVYASSSAARDARTR